MKLKDQIIDNLSNGIGIISTIESVMQEQGLKPYCNELEPGVTKGHWRSCNTLTIYKDEFKDLRCESVRICISKYGIRDKAMYYSIDHIDEISLNHQQEIEARIWADINDGIVGKTYE